jgi:hypothetical protein
MIGGFRIKDRNAVTRDFQIQSEQFPFTVGNLSQLKWVKYSGRRWLPCIVEEKGNPPKTTATVLVYEKTCDVHFLELTTKKHISSLIPFCGVDGCSGETCNHEWCKQKVNSHLNYLTSLVCIGGTTHEDRRKLFELTLIRWVWKLAMRNVSSNTKATGEGDAPVTMQAEMPQANDGDAVVQGDVVIPNHVNKNEIRPGDVINFFTDVYGPVGTPRARMFGKMIRDFDLTQRTLGCYGGGFANDIDDMEIQLVAKWDGTRHYGIPEQDWEWKEMKCYSIKGAVLGGKTGRAKLDGLFHEFNSNLHSVLDGDAMYTEALARINAEQQSSRKDSDDSEASRETNI